MIYKARIPFTSSGGLRYGWYSSSVMHGLIMEHTDTEYAGLLHSGQVRPFSQSVISRNGSSVWIVTALNDEAYEKILRPVLALESAEITQKNDTITFGMAEFVSTSYEELFAEHYIHSDPSRLVKMDILTPTAFKAGGKYINLPDPLMILSGAARRFDNDCDIHETMSDSLFEEIAQRVSFSSFDLHSASFPLERVGIPSFYGSVVMKVSGSETFCRYINMICDYASYTGIGIKTALGMGQTAYSVINKARKEEIS